MLSKQSQRYQKKLNLSVTSQAVRGLGIWLTLSIGLAGCVGAGAESTVVQSGTPSGDAVSSAVHNLPTASLKSTLVAPPEPQADIPPSDASLPVVAVPPLPAAAAAAEKALIDARDAMQKKQWSTLAALVPLAKEDPVLGSYAQYWLLRQQLQDPTQAVPTAALQQFMSTNKDAYLADKLKADWIVAAARTGDFDSVLRLGPVADSSAQVNCARLLAQHMTGQRVTAAQAVAIFAPANSCWAMMGQFVSGNVVGWKQLEPMLRNTLETTKTGDAQRLAALMFSPSDMVAYRALMANPKKWLATQPPPKSQAQIELVTLALSRLARTDRPASAGYVQSQWEGALPKPNLEWVWGQFGLVAALNVEGEAVQWYRRSGNAPMSDYNNAWQVRAELRQAKIDWSWVAKAINKMSPDQRAEPVWTYWHARALAAQGDQATAQKLYTSIEYELSFYGQLASEELGRTPSIPPAPAPVTRAELAGARSNRGLQRAIKLFNLGWRPEAVPEWNFTLRGMNDRQLLAAAELARQQQIFDRVVNTSLKTKNEIDFKQRFIAPFEGRVAEKARLINLDPAWVYGLIRQESRFITDARSYVGASGLMQLMPATARWVARKIGMNDFTPSSVNDFDTNTILGTNYLSMVLNDLNGSQVLATAGYNAGPKRPVLWRSRLGGPVEGAIFAETIPFTETRLYVKNVMSNATYYAMMFSGKPQSLKARLGVVSPEPQTRIDLP